MPKRLGPLAFGPFRLFPGRKLLLEGNTPVQIGARALDILIALVGRAGDLVTKEELLMYVWPTTTVHEANLRVHIAGLRRLLGDGQMGARYIVNVTGRGYCFVAPLMSSEEPAPATPARAVAGNMHHMPADLMRMVGRSDIVAALAAQLPERRFIAIVGPGGIGKTTVALAVAKGRIESYEHGARFVDLAPLSDPSLVPSALGSALGIAIRSENPVPDIIALLRDMQLLLVLDSCEHVLEAAAAMAEEILKGAPRVHILATSREPLRAQGERVQRLGPLAIPRAGRKITAVEALGFSAIQLFVERAAASLDRFEVTDTNASTIADICRRLDGVPLAIELAASRIDAFGVGGLAARLNDRFWLELRGRRTGLPRHQTLRATLDWSYEVLPDQERVILRRLGIFAGAFPIEAAAEITADPEVTASDVVGSVANLVSKSLVVAEVGGVDVRYRLLDTTRAYALQKLNENNEFESLARRHAEFFLHLFERAETERQMAPAAEWLPAYGWHIDDVRSALDWAFSPRGDVALGVALTVAAVPLWTHMSLNEECRSRVAAALASPGLGASQGNRREMQLSAALGGAQMYTRNSVQDTNFAWSNVLAIAEQIGDRDYQLRALWGLWALSINRGEFRAALKLARKFVGVATKSLDVADPLIGERIMGVSLYFLGELSAARRRVERMLDNYVAPANRSHITRYQFDQRIVANVHLAEILWLQGFPDQATHIAARNIDDAEALDHAISLTYALAQSGCPIALRTGDLPAAERFVTMMMDRHSWHGSQPWEQWGRCYKGVLLIKRGDIAEGIQALTTALEELPEKAFHMRYTAFLGELAEALGGAGKIAEGLKTIDQALAESQTHEEGWCIAELLRVKGELLVKHAGERAAVAAEEQFQHSLDRARRQEALSWELRTARSLARLWQSQGRSNDARHMLTLVYGRFTEGFETSDLKMAKSLIEELSA
jgi:predicted ATPase/DNA-binding winged helix-turn-helix (wHTH) protein